jgi:hypothetical protein
LVILQTVTTGLLDRLFDQIRDCGFDASPKGVIDHPSWPASTEFGNQKKVSCCSSENAYSGLRRWDFQCMKLAFCHGSSIN